VTCLVPVFGDQLSIGLASLQAADKRSTVVLMAEVTAEATYVRHHKKKIAFIFSAMRHFAKALQAAGWQVDYIRLDNPENTGSLAGEVHRAVQRHRPDSIVVTEPGEWRVLQDMLGWSETCGVEVDILDDDRFICRRSQFAGWSRDHKNGRMEFFYRDMRRRSGLLMDGDLPVGGKWNYDPENRKPAKGDRSFPEPPKFPPDAITREVIDLVASRFGEHFGDLEPFWFAVTPEGAQQALDHFLKHSLPQFGDFQDAMRLDSEFLYHAVISPYLNAGLLDPMAICRAAEVEYNEGRAPLNCVEGFIRQILGWREFVRGIYWQHMPDYAEANALDATRDLPWFYWSGETDMACLHAAIGQTTREAYAHHIQRLMITGNFALLAGVHPRQVHEWYLVVYADAYEWVEMPNTIGMSQFADGGKMGSKPYAAGGNYINKMSDYCRNCAYDVDLKTGPSACPFNYLYWDFLARNRDKIGGNPRLQQTYRGYDRLAPARKAAITASAKAFLDTL
jgi:deoxyribodipyrimidine photolyase-related protein